MFSCTHEVAAATSLAPVGHGLAGACRQDIFTPTMPLRAAKHIAASCGGAPAAGAAPSSLKLSPATNSSTGRGDVLVESPVATSSTFCSLSPYFRPRENDTPAHDSSGVASGGVSVPSLTSPAIAGLAAARGNADSEPRTPAPAMVNRKQSTRHLVMAYQARTHAPIPAHRRAVAGQASILVLGDLTAFRRAFQTACLDLRRPDRPPSAWTIGSDRCKSAYDARTVRPDRGGLKKTSAGVV